MHLLDWSSVVVPVVIAGIRVVNELLVVAGRDLVVYQLVVRGLVLDGFQELQIGDSIEATLVELMMPLMHKCVLVGEVRRVALRLADPDVLRHPVMSLRPFHLERSRRVPVAELRNAADHCDLLPVLCLVIDSESEGVFVDR